MEPPLTAAPSSTPGTAEGPFLRRTAVVLLVGGLGALGVLVSTAGPEPRRPQPAAPAAAPPSTAPTVPAVPPGWTLPREALPLDPEEPLTAGQIQRLMLDAGFPHAELGTGVALTLAESERVPAALNVRARVGSDRGLWQINDHYWAEEMAGTDWRDPAQNTRLAYRVWSESGWDAWAAYDAEEMGALPPPEPHVLPRRPS